VNRATLEGEWEEGGAWDRFETARAWILHEPTGPEPVEYLVELTDQPDPPDGLAWFTTSHSSRVPTRLGILLHEVVFVQPSPHLAVFVIEEVVRPWVADRLHQIRILREADARRGHERSMRAQASPPAYRASADYSAAANYYLFKWASEGHYGSG